MTTLTAECLREVEPTQDAPFLYSLYVSTRRHEVQSWGWADAQVTEFLGMQWKLQQRSYQAQYPNANDLLVICNNVPAGRCLLQETASGLHLIDFALLTEFRNRGLGARVLRLLQRHATELQAPLELSVALHNPAQRLYHRHGFTETSRSDTHITMRWLPPVVVGAPTCNLATTGE